MPPALPLSLLLILLLLAVTGAAAASEVGVLLAFKRALTVPPAAAGYFVTWDATAASPCNFTGVTCDPRGRVTAVSVHAQGVASASVPFDDLCAALPALATLSLPENALAGGIDGVVACAVLQDLTLAFNGFTGTVPDLSPLTRLRRLNVSSNSFAGAFPWAALAAMPDLAVLALGDNPFFAPTDAFPDEVTGITNLTVLYMSAANIGGVIPRGIGNLVNLVDLELSDNNLTGEMPKEIARLTNLQQLELYNNSLRGEIPWGFGKLTKLQYLDASQNKLTGSLAELRNLTQLVSLQLFYNGFTGEVPSEFGEFKELVNLSLYSNNLTGELPQSLGSWAQFNFIDVSTNALSGPIPPDMCKQGTMLKLLMLENNFSGGIPATYASCKTLQRFRVSKNALSGDVPEGLWALPNVNVIDLEGNQFTGGIGDGIGNAKALTNLLLAGNRFTGVIPPSIGNASSLEIIDVSSNELSGEIPDSIGRLAHLGRLNITANGISGAIPGSLGSCSALSTVDFSENKLTGAIPAELGNLSRLNSLDISGNDLSGAVPASLAALKLSYLNMSDNRLTGPVPEALAISAYDESFVGNPGLCATNGADFLRLCTPNSGGSSANAARMIVTCILAVTAVLLAVLGVAIYIKKRRLADAEAAGAVGSAGKLFAKKGSWDLKSFRTLAFDEREIIDGVRNGNLIGSGGSGNVYRVKLGNGAVVAVKHITRARAAAASTAPSAAMLRSASAARRTASVRCREFDSEVGTLSSIRHVNVVKLLCSITSEDGAASLLVYEHLPNGSLYERLHGPEGRKLGGLGWPERHDIAVGAAKGLEYLHHGCDRPILHRDVKSSNILLDESFKPRIADFGLAKILNSATLDSSVGVVAGTLGYMAPEYAYTWKVTEKSDVYSFGVVLLELVTGRAPIQAEGGESKDLVDWVSRRLDSRDKVMSLLDARISEDWAKEEAVRVLRVAVLCTSRTPSMRPSMRTVVQMLEDAAGGRDYSMAAPGKVVEVKVIP
ncbi:receptor-like protein kinase 7 [Phragmites australis]|uniref:receptor-like protein kinase 7 n=1 Tax=Phragmites australis TaxID=29695 RepID=UPI002D7961BB|nr:receptor-like protein kinase 7 [Phragmites australis]